MWFARIDNFYKKGYYTQEQVKVFVPKYITEEEYRFIIKE